MNALVELEEVDGGVRFRDRVHYRLPFGIFGDLAHSLFVRRTLARIFDYRTAKLLELLGGAASPAAPRPSALAMSGSVQ